MTGPEWTPQPADAAPQQSAPPHPAANPPHPGGAVRIAGLDPAQVASADDAEAQGNLDADTETEVRRSGGLGALLGRLFRRSPAPEDDSAPDADPTAQPGEGPAADPSDPNGATDDDDSDIAPPPRMRSWRPADWGWETRVGVATVVSFVILVGVFVRSRANQPTTKPPAEDSTTEPTTPPKRSAALLQVPSPAGAASTPASPAVSPSPASPGGSPTPSPAQAPSPAVAQAGSITPPPPDLPAVADPGMTLPPGAQPTAGTHDPSASTARTQLLLAADPGSRSTPAAPGAGSLPNLPPIDPTASTPPPTPDLTRTPAGDAPLLPGDPAAPAVATATANATTAPGASPAPADSGSSTLPAPPEPPAAVVANVPPASPTGVPPVGADSPGASSLAPAPGATPAPDSAAPAPAQPPPTLTAEPAAAPATPAAAPPPPAADPAAPAHPQPLELADKPNLLSVPPPGPAGALALAPGAVIIPNSGHRPGTAPIDDSEADQTASARGIGSNSGGISSRRVGAPVATAAERDEPSPGLSRSGETLYRVKENENLYTISRKYYGSGRYYKALYKENADLMPDIRTLYIGTVLRIPRPEKLDQDLIDPLPAGEASDGPAVSRASTTARGSGAEGDSVIAPRRSLRATAPRRGRTADPAGEPRRPTYRVARNNETLRSIARDTLGDSKRDGELFDLNRDQLESPRSPLQPNMILTLPDDAVPGRRSP